MGKQAFILSVPVMAETTPSVQAVQERVPGGTAEKRGPSTGCQAAQQEEMVAYRVRADYIWNYAVFYAY